jgi:RNA polymerase sigma-70 factor (ECF subfamily)
VSTYPGSIGSVSDAELVERARNGDRDAFGELVERHQGAVFRTALVALRSREEAEEVAQEAFILAMERLEGFRGESSFKTWLLAITWNRARDKRRHMSLWLRRFVNRDESHGHDSFVSPGPSQEASLAIREEREEVRRMIAKLPRKYRDPLLLSATGEHTFDQIAALLGVPVGTAKWRAMEGRRLLKERISRKAQGAGSIAPRGERAR